MSQDRALQREALLAEATSRTTPWDVVVIGGGATGLGTAVDAAARGYATLLLEQSDFGKGTSSRSTKLVHGGVRYLRQGDVSLVYEALHERGLLLQNAPHLTRNMEFLIPCYHWWEKPFYGAGLMLYDGMAGKQSLGGSSILSRRAVVDCLPTLRRDGLRGGIRYHDGQFDDARLAVNLAQTAVEQGGVVVNYARVDAVKKQAGRIAGVVATDLESGSTWEAPARVVINATGVFADSIRRMDRPEAKPLLRPSQGTHIVVDRSFLPGDVALMVPRTDDGRVLFAVPWHGRVIIGTTDTPLDRISLEPRALEAEVEFLLSHAGRYLDRPVARRDVMSVYAGLRPLVSADGDGEDTASISRDHVLRISRSGLVTITGGKWTTYRRMAEDTVDRAAEVAGLEERPCTTKGLHVHGWTADRNPAAPFAIYGADASDVGRVVQSTEADAARIHPELPVCRGEVRWAARFEMARTVDDVLSRRTRALLLNARASAEASEAVATLLAEELGKNGSWAAEEAGKFRELAAPYISENSSSRVVRSEHPEDESIPD